MLCFLCYIFFFCKQKTAYELRISDWSSDVCSSDLKSRGYKAAKFEENIGIELTWTIIPFLIIIGMAIPTTRTVVAMKDTSSADLTVKLGRASCRERVCQYV